MQKRHLASWHKMPSLPLLRLRITILFLGFAFIGVTSVASAQELSGAPADDADHAIVFELGAAGDWSPSEGFHPGGTVAFEVTPIEHWLELEVGATAIRAEAGSEIAVDLLFKKPWQLSRTIEFMAGAGPEIVHATGPNSETFWGIEAVADVMFWPRKNVGWYLEPGYEMTMRDGGRQHGLGIAVGLIIGR
jgi:hypothetical protein